MERRQPTTAPHQIFIIMLRENPTMEITIRPVSTIDSLEDLTALLHRAYAPLLEAGMRFYASHQPVDATARRIAQGECLVAERDRQIIGTITLYPSDEDSHCEWYRRAGVSHFGQFAVDPAEQRQGIGSRLLEMVEQRARENEATEIALDTAEMADALIAYYRSRGYLPVGSVRWKEVNYRSVVMSKTLGPV